MEEEVISVTSESAVVIAEMGGVFIKTSVDYDLLDKYRHSSVFGSSPNHKRSNFDTGCLFCSEPILDYWNKSIKVYDGLSFEYQEVGCCKDCCIELDNHIFELISEECPQYLVVDEF